MKNVKEDLHDIKEGLRKKLVTLEEKHGIMVRDIHIPDMIYEEINHVYDIEVEIKVSY